MNKMQGHEYSYIEEFNKQKILNKKLEKENENLQREYKEILKKNNELKTTINRFLNKLKDIFN